MPDESIELTEHFAVSPAQIYAAWLKGKAHARMTGGGATGEPRVGARYTAWDGYIWGENVELQPDHRIVQTWTTSEFPEGSPPSRLTILLVPESGGTKVTLRHSELPEGSGEKYREGWVQHYLEPMRRFFSREPSGSARKSTGSDRKVGSARKSGASAKKVSASAKKRSAAVKRVSTSRSKTSTSRKKSSGLRRPAAASTPRIAGSRKKATAKKRTSGPVRKTSSGRRPAPRQRPR